VVLMTDDGQHLRQGRLEAKLMPRATAETKPAGTRLRAGARTAQRQHAGSQGVSQSADAIPSPDLQDRRLVQRRVSPSGVKRL